MSFTADVAPGVHRVEDAYTNWYLVEDGDALTVVDAGVPTSWDSLLDALKRLGRSVDDIRALVLTHAHFDHVGFAEKARQRLDIPVYAHTREVALTRHPSRYDHEQPRSKYFATQVKAFPIVASLVKNRAFFPSPVGDVVTYEDGEVLDVPGTPRVVFSPGHTYGHCALHLPDRDALLVGDAFVMLDPYTARTGPRVVARAATADSERAKASLDALAATGAQVALTGHGEPWKHGIEAAVRSAKATPVA
ncbi:glyoxylase-like metal-dependent hydrolase (beta-lactamase superfamily II) [Solirubrobacter pauli]|uniref:Glyoxylase-like metal-dependent hydrolase (Beta-lactamase superfamily II) n=1 Tax=Solirubrobacter pauli TaxID=166793 RepID=A0A660KZV4_9ACTN|nr:MBL fold metallo-hydrolase [Solirubrobacter pauli]RKQ86192.1 glyoxylase-like metal-dependent hydrolase (beta-lactamase superfamily II) [Solirubrobacter pauli]